MTVLKISFLLGFGYFFEGLQVGGHPWISENHLLLRKDEQLLENITIYGKLSFDDSHLEASKKNLVHLGLALFP